MTAIYARQSVDKKDSISIEMQISECSKKTSGKYEVYSDKGFSGKNTERPEFARLMEDIKSGRINKIICYKLDRISRSLIDFAGITEMFRKYNVEFTSCNEDFDTSTIMGRAMLSIVMVFAQMERETIAQRVKDNYYERGKRGLYLGGRPPFGFNKIETIKDGIKTYKLESNSDAAMVLKIYEMYRNEVLSLGEICKKINDSRNKFPTIQIRRILKNPVYVKADIDVYNYLKAKGAVIENPPEDFIGKFGLTVYGPRSSKTTSKFSDYNGEHIQMCMHEGIIEPNVWLDVQTRLDTNAQIGNSNAGNNTWLSGILKCGYCKLAIVVANGNKNGKSYINCSGRKQKFCYDRTVTYTLDYIENAVAEELKKYFASFEIQSQDIQNYDVEMSHSLKLEIMRINDEITKIADSFADANPMMREALNIKISDLTERKKILEKQIVMSQKRMGDISEDDIRMFLRNWNNFTFERKKQIARLFLNKIYIYNDKIDIEWLF